MGLWISHHMQMKGILPVKQNGLDKRHDGTTGIVSSTNNGHMNHFTSLHQRILLLISIFKLLSIHFKVFSELRMRELSPFFLEMEAVD